MTLLHRDTELDDADDSGSSPAVMRRLRYPPTAGIRRYHGERPVHDTGRVLIGIARRRRQLNDDPIERHAQRRIWHGLTLLTVVVLVGLSMWRCAT